jgi:hypothetical protein
MQLIFEGGRRRPEFSSQTREVTMICHGPARWFPLLVVLAIALAPAVVEAQNYAFAACISRDEISNRVLTAPAAMALSMHPNHQTIEVCAQFCRTGSAPQGAEVRGNRSQFAAPYRYALFATGNWCFCGNEINGASVQEGFCQGTRAACLDPPTKKCNPNIERDHMVVDLNPPAGATTVSGGGSAGGGAPTNQPPPATGNRRPNAPTVLPGGWEPAFPLQYEGAYQMSWRNNGDPDNDVLTFGLIIWQYDWTRRQWMQMPGIRDQYGTYGMTWLREDNYTFTTRNGLSPQTHYAWMVFACDLGKGDAALCSWSGWGLFRTQ